VDDGPTARPAGAVEKHARHGMHQRTANGQSSHLPPPPWADAAGHYARCNQGVEGGRGGGGESYRGVISDEGGRLGGKIGGEEFAAAAPALGVESGRVGFRCPNRNQSIIGKTRTRPVY
jgi:hypothetical protein